MNGCDDSLVRDVGTLVEFAPTDSHAAAAAAPAPPPVPKKFFGHPSLLRNGSITTHDGKRKRINRVGPGITAYAESQRPQKYRQNMDHESVDEREQVAG